MAGDDNKTKGVGPLAFVIAADPDQKLVIFQFSRTINRIEFSADEAMGIASQIIGRAAVASGKTIQQLIDEKEQRNKVDAANKQP